VNKTVKRAWVKPLPNVRAPEVSEADDPAAVPVPEGEDALLLPDEEVEGDRTCGCAYMRTIPRRDNTTH